MDKMKKLTQYLSTNIKQTKILVNDSNIKTILEEELNRLGSNADLNHIDVSGVTDMHKLFRLTRFSGNVSKWDVSQVVNMAQMFQGTVGFECDLGEWNTENVKDMSRMFSLDSKFTGKGLENWNVEKVEKTDMMFSGCTLFNAPIGNWKLNSLRDASFMFQNCTSFDQDLSSWTLNGCKTILVDYLKGSRIARKKSKQPKIIYNP